MSPGGVIPRRTAIVDAAGLTCLWLISVLLIGPAGEFPLNDDWVYAAGVKSQMQRMDPGFKEKSLGFTTFREFVESRRDEVESKSDAKGQLALRLVLG